MYYVLYKEVNIVASNWSNAAENSVKLHDSTYWGCVSEAFYCLEYSSSNSSHGEGSPAVIHNPPGTAINWEPLVKVMNIY